MLHTCAVYIAVIKPPIAKKMFGVAIRRYCLFSGEKLPRDYDKAGRYLVWNLLKLLRIKMLSWIDFEIWKKKRRIENNHE